MLYPDVLPLMSVAVSDTADVVGDCGSCSGMLKATWPLLLVTAT